MDTNKIREKVAAVRRADDEWDAIPGGYDESEAILKYSTAVNELLAELDAAPKVLTTEPVAWMTEDGRLASVTGKENMPSAADKAFCIPLYLAPAAGLTVEEIVRIAASLGISEGLQASIDHANRLLEARSSQSRQPSEVLAEPVAWIVVSSIRDIGIPTLAITKEAARQVAIERCYYLSDVQHSEPIPLYLAPAAGLTVDEVIKCVDDEAWTARDRIEDDPMSGITDHITKMVSSIHARLIAAIQAKS